MWLVVDFGHCESTTPSRMVEFVLVVVAVGVIGVCCCVFGCGCGCVGRCAGDTDAEECAEPADGPTNDLRRILAEAGRLLPPDVAADGGDMKR